MWDMENDKILDKLKIRSNYRLGPVLRHGRELPSRDRRHPVAVQISPPSSTSPHRNHLSTHVYS